MWIHLESYLRNVAFSFFSFATKGNYIAKLCTGLFRNYVCKNTKND